MTEHKHIAFTYFLTVFVIYAHCLLTLRVTRENAIKCTDRSGLIEVEVVVNSYVNFLHVTASAMDVDYDTCNQIDSLARWSVSTLNNVLASVGQFAPVWRRGVVVIGSGVVVPERRSGKHFGAGTAFR